MSEEFHPNSVDAVLASIKADTASIRERLETGDKRLNEHDQRIAKLEGWRKYVVGVAFGVGTIISVLWELLSGRSKH